jgi:Xaa-Pro dipeptidase
MLNEERRARMRRAMEARQLDVLILRLPENVLLLSGHWPMIGAAYLIFPVEGKATCLVPSCYQQGALASLIDCDAVFYPYGGANDKSPALTVKTLLEQRGSHNWKSIGYEGNFEVAAPSWNAAEGMVPAADTLAMLRELFAGKDLVDVTALLLSERVRKTPDEIVRLAIASEVSCFGLAAFEEAVRIGVSGVELAAIVEQATMVQGTGYRDSVRVRAFAQVTTGAAETAMAHRPNVISTARPMMDGDFAVLELGVVVDGYWADRTRVRIAGTARDEQIKIFETVRKAQEDAISSMRPGVLARDVDSVARSVIEDAGYGAEFPHITGHGLGFGYHESSPILGPHSDDVLAEGMLTSVEPGIYTTTYGGCRIEDDVIVTQDGPQVLGAYRKFFS